MHEQFESVLKRLAESSPVSSDVLGDVLARVSARAPEEIARKDIASGPPGPDGTPSREIQQGTVSKAVKVLMQEGLLEDGERVLRTSEGRVLAPLRLGRRYAIAGVKVTLTDGRPAAVTTALVRLDGTALATKVVRLDPDEAKWETLAEDVHHEVSSLQRDYGRRCRREGLAPPDLFGVGVEIGAHVHNGTVVRPPTAEWLAPVPLGDSLTDLFGNALPVVVENDVNALAVLATHDIEFPESDLVVAAVMDEGVGGGLVMDGRLRRGGRGMAGELGHLVVGQAAGVPYYADRGQPGQSTHPLLRDFDPRCPCGSLGHLDAFATPKRIRAVLGVATLKEAAQAPAERDDKPSREHDVFYAAGSVLGRGITHVINIVNPSRLILWLPQELIHLPPDRAGAAYLTAMRDEMREAYSTGGADAEPSVEPLVAENVGVLGATAAAMCVLDGFIDHARGLDGCRPPQRRPSRGSAA